MDTNSYREQPACRDCEHVNFDDTAKLWECCEVPGHKIVVKPTAVCNDFVLNENPDRT